MPSAIAIEQTTPTTAAPQGSAPVAMVGKPGAAPLRLSAPLVTMWGLLAAAFVGLFHNWFYVQHRLCMAEPADWGHAYFVPLVSLYILWQHRDKVALARSEVFWPGVAPMLLGIASYFFFIGGYYNHMAQGWSLILTLFGLLLLLLGPGVMRHVVLPLGYLVFAVTISEPVMLQVTAQLQIIASRGSYALLNVIGVTTDISGVTLTVFPSKGPPIPLNVAEACSGMRQLISFLALGAAVALVACRFWWQRVALVMLAPPVAIFINVVRVAVLGVLSLWNPEYAQGEAHTFIGTLLLIPAFVLYMLIVWALNRAVRDVPEPAAEGGGPA